MNLFLPSDPRPVHFIGIGGAGMSALALLALKRGVVVTGTDRSPEGAADLVELGAWVTPHDPALVEAARAVIVSAAIPADHPELARARALGIPIVPRKRALADLVAAGRTIGIAGTHGKTTTTVMTTEALVATGFNPTGLAGGRVATWGGNARVGGDALFVVEADEYDQAFLELNPLVAVVNNVEPEHLECYDDSAEVMEQAFATFAGRARTALIGQADEGSERVARRVGKGPSPPARLWRFGVGAADLALREHRPTSSGSEALVGLPGGGEITLRLSVPGTHNILNAIAALGVVVALEGDLGAALAALEQFRGVGRRFERKGESGGVVVIDDYAHHATELKATLAAARQAFPRRRLVAVFQPHLFSRTAVQHQAMGEAVAAADLAFVTEIYAAREQPIPGVTGRLVAEEVERRGRDVQFVPERAELLARVAEALRPGDVVLTLGAGDITALGPELLERLAVSREP
ncbi:MAG TPA: UDP-N-acetylmuramate--L-alanine ligase [Gemmatimonadales bacterium]|nr:UDP-N-acetylmuramate--L-alanine ligase [Gemmatimonadales bacterium]